MTSMGTKSFSVNPVVVHVNSSTEQMPVSAAASSNTGVLN